jgi:hypothetical protein
MKNNLFKLYILSFFLLTDFISFAQPGQDQPGGGLEGDDPPPFQMKLVFLSPLIQIKKPLITNIKNNYAIVLL